MTAKSAEGFTLMEILIALGLIATFAMMTLMVVQRNSGEDKLLRATQSAAAEIAQAFSMYQKDGNIPAADTSAQDIVDYLNYVRIVSDGSISVQIADATFPSTPCDSGTIVIGAKTYGDGVAAGNGSRVTPPYTDLACDLPCYNSAPDNMYYSCAILQNGAVVLYNLKSEFGTLADPPYNTNAIRFYIDPDGPSKIQTATPFLLFYGGSISTDEQGYDRAQVYYDDPLNPGANGDGYVLEDRTDVTSLYMPMDLDEAPVLPATTGIEPINGKDGVMDDPEYLWSWARD